MQWFCTLSCLGPDVYRVETATSEFGASVPVLDPPLSVVSDAERGDFSHR